MDQLKKITERYNLSRLKDGNLDSSQIIFQLQLQVNNYLASHNLAEITNYNTATSGIRSLESNLKSRLSESDQIMLQHFVQEIQKNPHINEKVKLLYKKYDILNLIRDNRVANIAYSTLEGNTPGALSQLIANRITTHDSNFILLICGKVRTGKSMAAGRIVKNVTRLTNNTLDITDVFYDHDDFLQVKDKRRNEGTLKGSGQIMDEGGLTMDSQSWFEKDVKRVVNTLKTQGFDNTLTVIVTPMMPDIANKARGLAHAIMIPWKEWGSRYLELTDTTNIDYEKQISSWKFDFLDVDPMTGRIYKDKLKAAYGEIHKIDTRLPNKTWVKKYTEKSHKYKIKVQQNQRQEIEEERQKTDQANWLKEKAQELKKDWKSIQNMTKTKRHTKIMNRFNCGRTLADRIISLIEEQK